MGMQGICRTEALWLGALVHRSSHTCEWGCPIEQSPLMLLVLARLIPVTGFCKQKHGCKATGRSAYLRDVGRKKSSSGNLHVAENAELVVTACLCREEKKRWRRSLQSVFSELKYILFLIAQSFVPRKEQKTKNTVQVVIPAVLTRPRPCASWALWTSMARAVLQGWGAGGCDSLVLVAQHCTLNHATGQAMSSLLLKRRSGFELMYLELRSSLLPLSASVAIFWLDQTDIHVTSITSHVHRGEKLLKLGIVPKRDWIFSVHYLPVLWFGTGKV